MARPTFSRRIEQLEDRTTPAVAFALASNSLIAFDTAGPAAALPPVAVAGLAVGDSLVGIDFRPQNGFLYGLGLNDAADTVQLYSVSARTGFATPIGTPVAGVTGSAVGFDFNPTVDRARVVTDTGLNFRLDPNTGTLVGGVFDAPITGAVTGLDASAYTNDRPNVTVTTLYGLNAAADALVLQSNPNGGVTSGLLPITLGGLPLDFTAANGFDVPTGVDAAASNAPVASGSGFAALTVGGVTGVYAIDLVTGAATPLGPIIGAGGLTVQGVAVSNDLGVGIVPTVTLTADGLTIRRGAGPGMVTTATIGGVAAGEALVGIDWRPQTGQLFALGVPTAGGSATGTLYLIDPQTTLTTATAIAVGDFTLTTGTLPAPSVGYGIDFNPAVDRIRVVTGSGLDFRLNPNDGSLDAQDANPPGGTTAAAYTNGYGQAIGTGLPTTLYVLDSAANTLSIQNPPNSGTQTQIVTVTLNGAVLDFTAVNGFDIPPSVSVTTANAVASGSGVALLTVGGVTSAYAIDLTTGAATLVVARPDATGFTVGDGPAGAVGFSFPPGAQTRFQAGTTAAVTVTRTGGSLGAVTASVLTGGNAVAGTDFTGLPATVSFLTGQTTATITFAVPAGAAGSGPRTLILTLGSPTNGAVLSNQFFTPTLTIAQPLVVAPPTLPPGAVGTAYAQTLTATGSPGPITFAVTAGTLPAGLTLNPNSGAITGIPTSGGAFAFTITASDVAAQVTGTRAYTLTVAASPPRPPSPFAVGQDVGGGTVTVYNPDQTVKFGLPAFGVGYTLGVRTAMADVNGDGVADLIVGTGPGVASRVRVLDGVTQAELFSVQPFEGSFTGGVFVAGGDIDGDGKAEIVVTPDESGGPRVLIYNGGTFTQAASFFGIEDPNFRGGARAAVADINGDGFGDLIVAAGFGGGPRVAVFNGTTVLTALPAKLLPDFFAFEDTLRNGVYVGGGDVNGDGKADIITGGGPGGGPRVQIIDGAVALANGAVNVVPTANPPALVLANFFAGDPANRGGIRVTAKDLDGDLFADLVTGSGQGAGSQTTGYLGSALRVGTATPSFAFDAYPGFTGGVYVG